MKSFTLFFTLTVSNRHTLEDLLQNDGGQRPLKKLNGQTQQTKTGNSYKISAQ